MRNIVLMCATPLAALGTFIWLLWKHTTPVMVALILLFGFLYLLAAVRKKSRDLQVS